MKIRLRPPTDFIRSPEAHLTLNGWNIPSVNDAKYLDIIFDKRVTWRLHIK
jgi:hypothetical protein